MWVLHKLEGGIISCRKSTAPTTTTTAPPTIPNITIDFGGRDNTAGPPAVTSATLKKISAPTDPSFAPTPTPSQISQQDTLLVKPKRSGILTTTGNDYHGACSSGGSGSNNRFKKEEKDKKEMSLAAMNLCHRFQSCSRSDTGASRTAVGDAALQAENSQNLSIEGEGGDQSLVIRRLRRAVRKCKGMRCKCCRSLCPQTLLVIANFLFLLCGWGLIVGGVWLYLYQDTLVYVYLVPSADRVKGHQKPVPTEILSSLTFSKAPFVFIFSGGFIAGVSFLGCCGACAESVCFLGFYSLLLLFAICSEVLVASLSTQIMDHIYRTTSEAMTYQLENVYNRTAEKLNATVTEVAKVTWAWDEVQTEVKCCGVFGPQDYLKTSWFNNSDDNDGNFVPPSCCVRRDRKSSDNDIIISIENYCQIDSILFPNSQNQSKNVHTQGCHSVFMRWLNAHVGHFQCALFALTTIQIIDFISAWCLISHVRKKQSEYWWCDDDDDDF